MSKHERLAPSNKRWPKCAGSARMEEGYEDIAGEAAIDGTGSHEQLELCVNNGLSADAYLGEIIAVNHPDMPNGWTVHQDRCDRVQICLDYIDRRVGELQKQFPHGEIEVAAESQSDPGGMFGRDDWKGTCDITITVLLPDGECLFIEIIDYKDGRGWVDVENNSQLLGYLGGKMRPYVASGPNQVRPFMPENVGSCRITIVQPKTSTPIRYQDISSDDAFVKLAGLAVSAHATDDPEAPLTPGEWCQYCKANPDGKNKGHCTAAVEKSMSVLTDVIASDKSSFFELIDQAVADPSTLNELQLADLADAEAPLSAAFAKVKKEIELRLGQDIVVPGYQMHPGNGTRRWNKNEEEIKKMLKGRRLTKDQVSPPKLITFPALEKSGLLTKDQLKKIEEDHISVIASKTMSLKKVARVQLKDSRELFKDLPKPPTQKLSFL